ncbi:MAG: alkaline phosphatase family protein [Micropruina sp.]
MSMNNIEHVVVLMLENRSFDGLLGWLYEHDCPEVNIPPLKPGDVCFQGLAGLDLTKFVNQADLGLSSPPVRGTAGPATPPVAPGEEFEHVNMQYFDTETPAPGAVATMTGVLQDFVNVMRALGYSDSDIQAMAPSIMQTCTQTQLPVLNQLARHYAVCDEWFASVPSQTNPNRAFLMTGTSHGLVNNGQLETDKRAKELESRLGMGIGDDRFPESTIFNTLAAADEDWAVFWQTSYLPHKISKLLHDAPSLAALTALLSPAVSALLLALLTALKPYSDYIDDLASGRVTSAYTRRLFPAIQQISPADAHFKNLHDFHMLARAGQLPRFSYVEPAWTIAQSSTNAGVKNLFTQMGNDYHPPGNMAVGEAFLKDVYSSLIANQEAWNKTLLIITFDEAVGSFDHVAPPAAVPPWGDAQPGFPTNGFAFDRFGARVPTILVSPWIAKGTVFRSTTDVPYDHTSVIATTLNWVGQGGQVASFGQRTANAPTFENVLTLASPRTDAGQIGFLDVGRVTGEAVRFGDPILLRNQNGKHLTAAARTMKVGAALPSDDLMGFAVDLNLAAYFPTLGNGAPTQLTFVTQQPDAPSTVADGTRLSLVTLEPQVGAADYLGAWSDSHDCYYYYDYTQGGFVANESWIVRQASRHGQPLVYGDRVYLENVHFPGQLLTHDSRWLESGWITTEKGGDYWIVEPAVPPGFAEQLAACSWGANRIDAFGLDPGGNLLHVAWDGAWHWDSPGTDQTGASFAGPLTACSWGANRIDVFGLDQTANLLHLAWNGAWNWDSPGVAPAGAAFAGGLTACSWGPDRIDVFGLDGSGNLLHLAWAGAWYWESPGASPTGAKFVGQLTACSWGPNRIDVFGLDQGGNLLHLAWAGAWYWDSPGASPTGAKFEGELASCSWGLNRIDVFGLDQGGNLLHLAWNGAWNWDSPGASPAGARFAGQLSACSWGANRIDAFGLDQSGHVLHLAWAGSWQWGGVG